MMTGKTMIGKMLTHYQITAEIGEDGMSKVYQVKHPLGALVEMMRVWGNAN